MVTRNSSVDEIDERYCLNHAIAVKLLPHRPLFSFLVTFAYLIGKSRLFEHAHSDFFFIGPYKYSYLLTN